MFEYNSKLKSDISIWSKTIAAMHDFTMMPFEVRKTIANDSKRDCWFRYWKTLTGNFGSWEIKKNVIEVCIREIERQTKSMGVGKLEKFEWK
jgi:hypothetical protein